MDIPLCDLNLKSQSKKGFNLLKRLMTFTLLEFRKLKILFFKS